MQKRMMLNSVILLTSSLNYAGIVILNIVWKFDLLLYLLAIFFVSCLMGVILVDIKKSLIYACASLFSSAAIVTAIMLLPPLIIGEGASVISDTVMSTLNAISKLLLFNLMFCIIGAIVGSMIGELWEPLEEIDI